MTWCEDIVWHAGKMRGASGSYRWEQTARVSQLAVHLTTTYCCHQLLYCRLYEALRHPTIVLRLPCSIYTARGLFSLITLGVTWQNSHICQGWATAFFLPLRLGYRSGRAILSFGDGCTTLAPLQQCLFQRRAHKVKYNALRLLLLT